MKTSRRFPMTLAAAVMLLGAVSIPAIDAAETETSRFAGHILADVGLDRIAGEQRQWLSDLSSQVVDFLPRLASGVVVFLLFWLGAVAVRRMVVRGLRSRNVELDLADFFGQVAKVGLLLFGAVSGLGTMGIDVGALVAGLGLTGFALGFALKDIISNVLAGILVIFYKPFEYDDHISVGSFQGTVTSIDLRYTVLDAEEKNIFVPNSLLFTNAITVEKKADGS